MNQAKVVLLTSMVLFLASCEGWQEAAQQDGAGKVEKVYSAKVKAFFEDPPRGYSSGPLWVWNDMLTEEQITSTLRDLAEQKVKQVFVHPRPGLMTPYLSDDWFRLWKVALKEAERLDMNVWIYDENSYPSGFAGGFVPDVMPESRGRGLHIREAKQPPQLSDDIVGVYKLNGDSFENVTERIRSGEELAESQYLVASVRRAGNSPWFGGKSYVDLLYPGVTEKFLEVTMEAYRRQIGDEFGKRVPGVFTDEPHLRPAGGFTWTDDLPQVFEKRWGYDLMDNLPSLSRPVGEWKRVRHNYFQVVLELFIERWGRPYYEYCEKYGIEFTGHYWEHEWPNCVGVPDNMAMSAWQQRPGIDTLMNQYSEDTHAQFGNIRAVKELSSLVNQLGRKRTICEAYGAGGWDLRFEDMKRIGDWLYVLGINTLNEHLSYITLRGARKRDHPQSFSYHEPWWRSYHVMASYFTRLSAALSQGEQVNTVLLIEPTTTAWMYQADSTQSGHLGKIGSEFQNMVVALSKAQVEYDIGCEDVIARHGGVVHTDLGDEQGRLVSRSKLRIGNRVYLTIILPPNTENLNAPTMRLLEQFQGRGTRILCCGDPPTLIEGQPSDRAKKLAESSHWQRVEPEAVTDIVLSRSKSGFAIRRSQDDKGILLSHRRRLGDGDILFLVNTSIDSPTSGEIESSMKSVEQWDPETGTVTPYPFKKNKHGIKADFELSPCGSLLLFLSKKAVKPAVADSAETSKLEAAGPLRINRMELNVLTLDFVDIIAGGETRKNIYFYQANQFAFKKNGMDRNPWDSAVQFRDELITKEFSAESGFDATYRFTITDSVPSELFIVIERPDLYSITCNDKAVSAAKGSWWLDKAFGKIDIAAIAKVGENTVTIKASPMTIYHELEPAYVLGDFALKAADSGFVIVPDRELSMDSRRTHSSVPDGSMWLSTGIGYSSTGTDAQQDDQNPWIVFDLGGPEDLDAIRIWNYNESNITRRGVKKLRITASTSARPDSFDVSLGTFDLNPAPGSPTVRDFSQRLSFKAKAVRFVRFDILSNHNGVNFPTTDGSSDNAFVGLSEVRFYTGPDNNLQQKTQVRVADVSSQLTHNFNRRAQFLVDASGLTGIGWNQQGYPFYSASVSYKQNFNIARPTGKYYIRLSDWYGSVAKVIVNGKSAGHIYCQPWECEVTGSIKKGSNTIEVVVIGTLKNTLGPHHGNHSLGSAWPGMFHSAPETGPPPGVQYRTVGYGLFEPFELSKR